uniref:Uncharacterized protein n=1 Tax=Physcomitrium patens TaxID=3218 RepID=A0A2K1J4T1_PHYPA|nr:hypothetical protein PHYPA_022379 [Physcomitrium patens]
MLPYCNNAMILCLHEKRPWEIGIGKVKDCLDGSFKKEFSKVIFMRFSTRMFVNYMKDIV